MPLPPGVVRTVSPQFGPVPGSTGGGGELMGAAGVAFPDAFPSFWLQQPQLEGEAGEPAGAEGGEEADEALRGLPSGDSDDGPPADSLHW